MSIGFYLRDTKVNIAMNFDTEHLFMSKFMIIIYFWSEKLIPKRLRNSDEFER